MTETPTLGGSTIAAACGIDPWTSPIRLWGELTGRPGFAREQDAEALWWGKADEPLIFDRLGTLGFKVERTPGLEFDDPSRPWLIGHPDGFCVDRAPVKVIDAKSTSQWVVKAVGLAPPQHAAQVQTYLHLTGCPAGLLAVRVGHTLHVVPVPRNEHEIALLLAVAERFVRYVAEDEQPPPAGHPDDRAALADLYPRHVPGRAVREPREIRDARRELLALLAAEKARHERIEHLRAVVTDFMGDAETLISSHDEVVATWRTGETTRFDGRRHKAEQPDCYASYATTRTERRFLLK